MKLRVYLVSETSNKCTSENCSKAAEKCTFSKEAKGLFVAETSNKCTETKWYSLGEDF